jgi:hypothetical protein
MHYIFIPRIIIALAALVHTVQKHVLSSILYHISPCPINFIPVLFKHSPSFALKRCTRTCSSLNCVFSPDRVLVENPRPEPAQSLLSGIFEKLSYFY